MTMEAEQVTRESKLSGLLTYFSILFTPKVAFERLSKAPTWGWAALAGIALTIITLIVLYPAQSHLASVMQQQKISEMPADQQAQAKAAIASMAGVTKVIIYIGTVIGPWIGWLIGAIFFLVAAALTGGEAKFARAWVASVNAYVVYAVAAIVNAIIVSFRDPASVNSVTDILGLPSLGMFFSQNHKLALFLSVYNVLYIWYYVIIVIALEQVLKVPRRAAIIVTVIYSLLWALIAMTSAR